MFENFSKIEYKDVMYVCLENVIEHYKLPHDIDFYLSHMHTDYFYVCHSGWSQNDQLCYVPIKKLMEIDDVIEAVFNITLPNEKS